MSNRVWVISELYYPEDTSTGYVMTRIAEGLASQFSVNVLCSQPTYAKRGTRAPKCETHNNVKIFRTRGATLNKDILLLRIINLLTISLSIFWSSLRHFRPNDRVIVVTNPPSLPFVIAIACWIRRAKCILLVHDVYPDVLTAAGVASSDGIVTKCIAFFSRQLYRRMAHVIVLGRDMYNCVLPYIGLADVPISIIPNWSDLDEIVPLNRSENKLLAELHLSEKFVVQYCGNMGRTHGLETLFEAARQLKDKHDIHFLFVGSGAKKDWLEQAVKSEQLTNITVLSRRPRNELNHALTACDLTVISFVKGMAGVSVPSRMYNALSAGTPILAIADANSELALVVEEEKVGWVVPPDAVDQVMQTILYARDHSELVKVMGVRARRSAEMKYSLHSVISAYCELLTKLDSSEAPISSPNSVVAQE